MTRFILVRPGSTDFDDQGRIKGNLDIPLNSRGTTQVERTAEDLRRFSVSQIYTSPCQPAWETADVLSKTIGAKVKRLDRLTNLDRGLWQGELIDELKRKHPKVYRMWQETPELVCPPGGETVSIARERVQGALEKLRRKHRTETIAIVAPEPMLSLIRCELTRDRLSNLWKAECECGDWEIVDVNPIAEIASPT